MKKSYEKIEAAARAAYKEIEEQFTERFLNEDGSLKTGKVGEAVTEGYKKVEGAVVDRYKKIEDAFVSIFLEKMGEVRIKRDNQTRSCCCTFVDSGSPGEWLF